MMFSSRSERQNPVEDLHIEYSKAELISQVVNLSEKCVIFIFSI